MSLDKYYLLKTVWDNFIGALSKPSKRMYRKVLSQDDNRHVYFRNYFRTKHNLVNEFAIVDGYEYGSTSSPRYCTFK